MDDNLDDLVVDIRASTENLARDLAGIERLVDGSLNAGFDRAGAILERGLIAAIRRGSLGFEELKTIASRAFDDIAAQALRTGIGTLFGSGSSGIGGLLGQTFVSLLGLPGRATGGPVAPGSAYLVGERGPEVFVPTSSGMIQTNAIPSAQRQEIRVAVNISPEAARSAPAAMQRSSRQVASAVRRAVFEN